MMKCHSTEKNVRYGGVYPIITNYLVNNKNICNSGITKFNQVEQWNIHHAKQSTDLRMNSYILIKQSLEGQSFNVLTNRGCV